MGAVWMRSRAEWRARWRAIVGLALIVGVAGGAATAAAAGARRTATAYERFVEEYQSYDVIPGGISEDDPKELKRIQDALATLPQVAAFATGQFLTDAIRLPSGRVSVFPEALVLGDAAGHGGFEVNRFKVISGRLMDRTASDEAMADILFADRVGLRVGDRVDILLRDFSGSEPKEIVKAVTIVGIALEPGGMPAAGSVSLTGLSVSPAFVEENLDLLPPNEEAPAVRLKRGTADIPAFIEAAREIDPQLDFPVTLPLHLAGVRRTLRFEVIALQALAALLALASMAILGQALGRQSALEAGVDYRTLRSLGMSRTGLFWLGMIRASVIGAIGAIVAVVVAIVVSPLTPIGLSRFAEPSPGIHIDTPAVAAGVGLTFLIVLLLSVIPAWRASVFRPNRDISLQASSIRRWVAGGSRPSMTAGLGMALEPGRGSRAVPTRQAVVGTAVGAAAILAASIFATSLTHLIETPSLYGFGWDVVAVGENGKSAESILQADPDVAAFALGGYGNIMIKEKQLLPFIYPADGDIAPTILEGRVPRKDDEIALGTALMRSLKLRIGSSVDVSQVEGGVNPRTLSFKVVGRTVVPPVFFQALEPAEGTAMSFDALFRLEPRMREELEAGEFPYVINYREGVDVRAKVDGLRAKLPNLFVIQVSEAGAEFTSLTRVSGIPIALAGLLGVMALASLSHAMGSTVRRRRRDLAVLRTLGFSTGQVRVAVAWQASALAVAALAIGLPVGAVAGGWLWTAFAEGLGFIAVPITNVIAILLGVVGTLLAANLAAALPGRAAARTEPAVVLRTE